MEKISRGDYVEIIHDENEVYANEQTAFIGRILKVRSITGCNAYTSVEVEVPYTDGRVEYLWFNIKKVTKNDRTMIHTYEQQIKELQGFIEEIKAKQPKVAWANIYVSRCRSVPTIGNLHPTEEKAKESILGSIDGTYLKTVKVEY